MLTEFYKNVKSQRSDFEVVLVAVDNEVEQLQSEYGELPWPVLPPDDERVDSLKESFAVSICDRAKGFSNNRRIN